MEKVIVLNADYSFLNLVSVERAFLYIAKGKVYVEKFADKIFTTDQADYKVPKVVRFIKFIRQVYSRKIPWTKKNVLIRDMYTCQYCGTTDKNEFFTVDHVVPKSKGGKNSFDNCVCSCFQCNNKKGDRTPHEARMFLKKKPVQPTISEFARAWSKSHRIDEILKELGLL